MAEKESPLPEPPKRPFGMERHGEEKNPNVFLLADRMAMAMAEGRIEEFLDKEMPDNENARKLARMVMGMTGMRPPEVSAAGAKGGEERKATETEEGIGESGEKQIPGEVRAAALSGDLAGLVDLLKGEHEKRKGDESKASAPELLDPSEQEKQVLGRLMHIASAHGLSLDWVVMRALTLYIRDYEKTGRL